MSKLKLNSDPSRINMIEAIKAEYQRIEAILAPHLVVLDDPEMRSVNVAQNILRDAITVVLAEMLPYTHTTVLEVAIRSASYALSAAPLEDQDHLVSEFMAVFANAHMERTAKGQVIESQWRMVDGREMPNFPKDNDHG